MPCKCSGIGVMSREPVWRGFLGGAVIFGMQNSRFFPERTLQFEGGDFTSPVVKGFWQYFSDPRLYCVPSGRLLICKRSELQFDRTFQVFESSGLFEG